MIPVPILGFHRRMDARGQTLLGASVILKALAEIYHEKSTT